MDFGLNDIKNDTIFGYTKEELGINTKSNYFDEIQVILNRMSDDEFYVLIDECIKTRKQKQNQKLEEYSDKVKFMEIRPLLWKGSYKGKHFKLEFDGLIPASDINFIDYENLTEEDMDIIIDSYFSNEYVWIES